MAKAYVERLAALIGPLASGRFKGKKIEVKHFFSGAAVYANGKICISLTPVGLALKLPERSRTTLLKRKGTKPLRYFPQGPIKKEYVVLPKTMVNDRRALRHLIQLSINNALDAKRSAPQSSLSSRE